MCSKQSATSTMIPNIGLDVLFREIHRETNRILIYEQKNYFLYQNFNPGFLLYLLTIRTTMSCAAINRPELRPFPIPSPFFTRGVTKLVI